jgi:hypothetical protein
MQFSMCTEDLLNNIKETKRDQVILYGIEAHVCVLQTSLDLIENGYDVTVVRKLIIIIIRLQMEHPVKGKIFYKKYEGIMIEKWHLR